MLKKVPFILHGVSTSSWECSKSPGDISSDALANNWGEQHKQWRCWDMGYGRTRSHAFSVGVGKPRRIFRERVGGAASWARNYSLVGRTRVRGSKYRGAYRNSTPQKIIMLKMKIPIVLVFLILTCVLKDYAGKLSILIMMQPTGIIRPTDYMYTETWDGEPYNCISGVR